MATGRGASGGEKGSGPREDPSTHPKLLQRAMKKERPMQSGGAWGLSRETLFPMTSAALEKKKKGEKKSVNPQSAQLSKPNGRLPKAARSEALALIPQPTEKKKKIKTGVSSGELIARVLLSGAACLPPPHVFWAVPHYLAYLSSQSSHKQLWLTTPLPY